MTWLNRWGVVPTYRCNQACKDCNRFLNLFPWPDSDLTSTDLAVAGEIVNAGSNKINRIRMTGGEPLMHKDIVELCRVVNVCWKPERCLVVFSNGKIKRPDKKSIRARWCVEDQKEKLKFHRPWMISPTDVGLNPRYGWSGRACFAQDGCGRLFDAFGFAPCVHAAPLGRLLRIDVYGGRPVTKGSFEMCKHCVCSVGRRQQWKLWKSAKEGEIEYPTRTYREAIARFRDEPYTYEKRFRERLRDERSVVSA